ncbi:hypothetical protein OG216_09670 [Streptomycetaceae bacterium NBC_01309]
MPRDPAAARYRETTSISRRVAVEVQRIWRTLTASRIEIDLEGAAGRRILDLVVAGQLSVAAGAQRYVAETVAASRQTATAGLAAVAGLLQPRAFAGAASDGRPLATLLYVPAITVASRRAAGASDEEAMLAGLFQMTRFVSTQIADASRASTQVAMVANPAVTMYARVVNLPACARCIVLAGRTYRTDFKFERHPACDCEMKSVTEDEWRQMQTPQQIFDGMSPEQQRRVFGVDGSEAIRMGADINQVVNARRGMESPGDATTTEGSTVRSYYAHRLRAAGGDIERGTGRYGTVTTPRLTPEGIFARTTDRDEQLALLRRYAYLT